MALNAAVVSSHVVHVRGVKDVGSQGMRDVFASWTMAFFAADIPLRHLLCLDVVSDGVAPIAEGPRRSSFVVRRVVFHPPVCVCGNQIRFPGFVDYVPLRAEREVIVADFLEIALLPDAAVNERNLKQRYFEKVGDDYFPLGAQWDIVNKAWKPYLVPANADWWVKYYPPDNKGRPTGPLCDGCHSVGYDIKTKQVAEWNVGCEKCHGPGSEHVAHPLRTNIFNPAHMDYVAANDSCIQCHSQGEPLQKPLEGKYYDWPVGYQVGLNLKDFWKLEDHKFGELSFSYFPQGTSHKNRMQGNDYIQSVMYRHGVTCFDCHDVNGTDNYAQLREPAQMLCLECHGPKSPNGPREGTLTEHTHHKEGSAGSECIACHMPKIETTLGTTMVRAHTFAFITPSDTEKYAIPNPCTECHKDKSTQWAEDALRTWPTRSPWRIEGNSAP